MKLPQQAKPVLRVKTPDRAAMRLVLPADHAACAAACDAQADPIARRLCMELCSD